MKGRVLTSDLHRMAFNALKYSNKRSALKGDVIWIRGAHGLRVVATDDYFVIVDRADASDYSGKPEVRHMVVTELKQLELDLRTHPDEYFDLEQMPLDMSADYREESVDALTEADRLVFDVDSWKESFASGVALAPDRLRNLALIRASDDYPIDIRVFENDGEQLLAFRIGPTIRGLISPLDRAKLMEAYKDQPEVLW